MTLDAKPDQDDAMPDSAETPDAFPDRTTPKDPSEAIFPSKVPLIAVIVIITFEPY